jgi:alkylation response protein AidB-like acyl-CoA dehydrogenase
MTYLLDDDRAELAATVRRFTSDAFSEARVRADTESEPGYRESVWRVLTEQLGAVALIIPESAGGFGFGPVEQSLVLMELGACLATVPYFSTAVLAAQALLHVSDQAAAAPLLAELSAGTVATVAANGLLDGDPARQAGVTASRRDGRWVLDGRVSQVLDGAAARLVLVAAQVGDQTALFAGRPGAALEVQPLRVLDTTRRQAALRFAACPAEIIDEPGHAGAVIAAVLTRAVAGLAAEQLGGSDRLLRMCVDYAKIREQFGRPIGSFQAVKHKIANMLIDIEGARVTVQAAAAAFDRPGDVTRLASLAKAVASDTYMDTAREAIQVHGGIGFTWECGAQLHFKRAQTARALFGLPAVHRRAVLNGALAELNLR